MYKFGGFQSRSCFSRRKRMRHQNNSTDGSPKSKRGLCSCFRTIIRVGVPLLLVTYFFLVPSVLTWAARGRVGTTTDGRARMRIDYAQPWPSSKLWVYSGTWLKPDMEIDLPDGGHLTIGNQSFSGHCFVFDMSLVDKRE